MTKHSPHISRRGVRRSVVVALLFAALCAVADTGPGSRSAEAARTPIHSPYCWPVAPFNRQHPIRGGFGDPRTLFHAPPTLAGLYHGAGSFSFHQGVDISAPDGTAVYPVVDGVVSSLNADRVFVDSGNGNHFEYWHIAPSVQVGQARDRRAHRPRTHPSRSGPRPSDRSRRRARDRPVCCPGT